MTLLLQHSTPLLLLLFPSISPSSFSLSPLSPLFSFTLFHHWQSPLSTLHCEREYRGEVTAQQHAAAAGEVAAAATRGGGCGSSSLRGFGGRRQRCVMLFRAGEERREQWRGGGPREEGGGGGSLALRSLGEGERDRYTRREGRESPSGRALAGLAASATER